jgi:hypothetical protein
MGYAQPAFMVDHLANEAGIVGITTNVGGALSDDGKRALIDFQVGNFAMFDVSSAFHTVEYDFGVNASFNRVVIPAGHDMAGVDLAFPSADNPSYTSPSSHGTLSPVLDGIIDFALTNTGVSHRYWRAAWGATVGAWQLSQIWWGWRTQLTAAAHVQPDWDFESETPTVSHDWGTRVSTLVLGPARRRFSLSVERIDPATADYTILNTVARTGATHPFYYWPPDTEDAGPFLVALDREARIRQGYSIPNKAIRYDFNFEFREVVS